MFKGIATAAFGLGVALTVVFMASEPASTAATVSANITIVKKNTDFPLKRIRAVESCNFSTCADV